jgi:4-carboxymuconolactone decarboxylase
MTTPDGQTYIDAMASRAGFVLDYHMLMARHDVGVLKAVNDLREQIRLGSALDDKAQELVYVVGYTVAGFPREHLVWHTRAALEAGNSPKEIHQALQIVGEVAGAARSTLGVEVLTELTGYGKRDEWADGPRAERTAPLDRRTREILLALGEAVNCGREDSVARHTRAAFEAGATPREVLDAFEFLPLISGVITFMHAVETWAEVTGADGLEPTVPYFTMNNDGTPRSSG